MVPKTAWGSGHCSDVRCTTAFPHEQSFAGTHRTSVSCRSKSPRTPKPQHPLSAMSYCHMSFDWCSEAIANAVGGECISYVGGNLCLSLPIQAGNFCCDRGC